MSCRSRADRQTDTHGPGGSVHRVFQSARDVGLPYQIVESLWPVFSGEDLVAHALNLNALIDASKHKSVNQERKTKQDFELLIERWTLDVERWTFAPCSQSQDAACSPSS